MADITYPGYVTSNVHDVEEVVINHRVLEGCNPTQYTTILKLFATIGGKRTQIGDLCFFNQKPVLLTFQQDRS